MLADVIVSVVFPSPVRIQMYCNRFQSYEVAKTAPRKWAPAASVLPASARVVDTSAIWPTRSKRLRFWASANLPEGRLGIIRERDYTDERPIYASHFAPLDLNVEQGCLLARSRQYRFSTWQDEQYGRCGGDGNLPRRSRLEAWSLESYQKQKDRART